MRPLDPWMPVFDFNELHATTARAPLEVVDRDVRGFDLQRSWVIRALVTARGMRPHGEAMDRSGIEAVGFVLLDEQPLRHVVLGLTGRFWKPRGDILRVPASQFRDFAEPGFAQATWGFELEPQAASVRITTETRVRCTDEVARRSFRRYWFFVRPFSGLIRRLMLRGIRERCEAAARELRS